MPRSRRKEHLLPSSNPSTRRQCTSVFVIPSNQSVLDTINVRPVTPQKKQPATNGYGGLGLLTLPSTGSSRLTYSPQELFKASTSSTSMPQKPGHRPVAGSFQVAKCPDPSQDARQARKKTLKKRVIRRWSEQELKTLTYLGHMRMQWTLTVNDVASIMNALFCERNEEQGSLVFRRATVGAQLGDLQAGRNRGRNGLWATVGKSLMGRSVNDPMIDKLTSCAQQLGISLAATNGRPSAAKAGHKMSLEPQHAYETPTELVRWPTVRNRISTSAITLEAVDETPMTTSTRQQAGVRTASRSLTTALRKQATVAHPVLDAPVKQEVQESEAILQLWQRVSEAPGLPTFTLTLLPQNMHMSAALTRLGHVGSFYRCQPSVSGSVPMLDGSLRAAVFVNDALISPPLPADHGYFLRDAAIHLQRLEKYTEKTAKFDRMNREYIPSPFLSVSESIVHVYNRAYREWVTSQEQNDSEIYVMSSARLCREQAVYEADTVLRELRARQMVRFNKVRYYKGAGERLVWGEIPATAIDGRIKFSTLIAKANSSPGVWRILRFGHNNLKPSRGVPSMRKAFASAVQRTALGEETATGMGQLLRLFGVPTKAKYEIAHFVYGVVQGFVLLIPYTDGKIPERVLEAFLKGVGKKTKALKAGFALGVLKGQADLEKERIVR